MTIEYFGKLLKGNNGICVADETIIYRNFNLVNFKTNLEKKYGSLDELLDDNPDIKDIILKTDTFYNYFD